MLLFISLIIYLGVVQAANVTVKKRAVIDHDSVQGFSETVPDRVQGRNYLRFKPYLDVVNGCVPFPAVDKDGNTGGGLEPKGETNGDCSSSTGQVYARSGSYDGKDAIMYSWYWPKDEISDGKGHRHDWESAVVWIDDLTSADPSVKAISVSAYGNYTGKTSNFHLANNTRPLFRYYSNWPIEHQLGFTTTQGSEQPLIAWESLSDAAVRALNNTDFGDVEVPFKDSVFQNNLVNAYR